MTIGLLMRKANVTPSGTPASTKPMKSGTAEHEQNGVTIPQAGGADRPHELPATDEGGAHLLGREEAADEGDGGHDAEEQQEDLGHVEDEERDRLAEMGALLEAEQLEREPAGERCGQEPGDDPDHDREADRHPERQVEPMDGERRHRRSLSSARAAVRQATSSRS